MLLIEKAGETRVLKAGSSVKNFEPIQNKEAVLTLKHNCGSEKDAQMKAELQKLINSFCLDNIPDVKTKIVHVSTKLTFLGTEGKCCHILSNQAQDVLLTNSQFRDEAMALISNTLSVE